MGWHKKKEPNIKFLRADAIRTAKDLCYGDDVIAKLKVAETENEITRIMISARKKENKCWKR